MKKRNWRIGNDINQSIGGNVNRMAQQ